MHQHRRNEDIDETRHRGMQAAADSTLAKFSARVVTPVLLSALLVVGGFIGSRLVAQIDDQGRDITKIKGDLAVVSTRLDEGVIRQVNDNGKRIDKMED